MDLGRSTLPPEAFALFRGLLLLESEPRLQELARLSETRPELYPQVLALVAADIEAQAQDFLEGDALQLPPAMVLGAQFGPYQLDRPLGTGGMGEVWLAHRADGLYEGAVAVKTLHPHLARSAVRERFAREGRLLSKLSHPNIARLLDAGVSAKGELFLVLEYVEGERIDHWCDQRRLGIDGRLKLFLSVCDAVAHAHAHLVVHRDLKPSNLMVTIDGLPKLLDFGIATVLESTDAADAPGELTRSAGRALTPEYAAPEQIRGEPASTAADIYALGVLLYRLLGGGLPCGAPEMTPGQIEREVLETEPVLLTASLTRPAGTASAADIAARRSTTPAALKRQLRGGLEHICARALMKAAADRYATVAALADDLRRHMEHLPISARGESLASRAAKLVRRHRAAVLASAAVALALVAGVAGIAREAEVARDQANKAEAVKNFVIDIFQRNSADRGDVAGAAETTARTLLDQGARRIRTELGDQPALRAELLGVIGELYRGMLLTDEAVALLTEQMAVLASLPDSSAVQQQRITAEVRLGTALVDSSRYTESRQLLESALADMEAGGDGDSLERLLALIELGAIASQTATDKGKAADGFLNAALRIAENKPEFAAHRPEILMRLGLVASGNRRDFSGAESLLREALRLYAAQGTTARTAIAEARQELGEILREQQRYPEAETELRAALAARQTIFPPDSPWIADDRRMLAKLLIDSGQRTEALELMKTALSTVLATRGDSDINLVADIRFDLGRLLWLRGLPDAAASELEATLALYSRQEVLLDPTLTRLARVRIAQGLFAEATALLDRARPLVEGRGLHSLSQSNLLTIEAELALARGDTEAAGRRLSQATEAWTPEAGRINSLAVQTDWAAARQALATGQPQTAERAMRSILVHLEAAAQSAAQPDEEAHTRFWLGEALHDQGRYGEAEIELRRAIGLRERLDDPASIWLARARVALAQALIAQHRTVGVVPLLDQAEAAYTVQPHLANALPQALARARQQLAVATSLHRTQRR